MIRAVIFDRDFTLLYPDPARVAHIHAELANIVPDCVAHIEDHWARWPGPWPTHEDDEPWFWQHFWTPLATRFGWSRDISTHMQTIGPRYATCFQAFPDALPALQAIRERDVRMGVLTNFGLPSVARTLEAAGLPADWFDCLVSAGSLGMPKPDSRAYHTAASQLGLACEHCLFIDDLVENVAGAAAVGMHGVHLDRSGKSRDSDTITTLLDVSALLVQRHVMQ